MVGGVGFLLDDRRGFHRGWRCDRRADAAPRTRRRCRDRAGAPHGGGLGPPRRQGNTRPLLRRPRGSPRSRGTVGARRSRRLLSLRDTARAMSQENVERLREAFDNFLAGKSEWGAELLDPNVEWDGTNALIFDIDRVYHGQEGVRQYWREWLSAWETVQFEYELV